MTSPVLIAQSQIQTLSEFLGPSIQFTPSRTLARQKLQKLNDAQFAELSTDVYDEVLRRKTEPIVPFLPINESFHPKRNQARQKLSTLPESRFVDLASDVYVEMKKRFPSLNSRDEVTVNTNEIPPRSVGASMTPSIERNLSVLESDSLEKNKMIMELKKEFNIKETNYQEQLKRLNAELQESKSSQIELQRTLESTLSELESYKTQLEQVKLELLNCQSSKTSELEKLKLEIKEMESNYNKIHEENEGLREDYTTQEQMLIAIRSEATNLLHEIKRLGKVNQDLNKENQDLKSNSSHREIKEVKEIPPIPIQTPQESIGLAPITTTKTLLNSSQARTTTTIPMMDFDSSSIVPIDKIQSYKDAIVEINSESKEIESSGVLFAMKKVVLACKSITEFIESKEGQRDLSLLKKDLSIALTKLMESAKNHVTLSNKNSSKDIYENSQTLTRVVAALANSITITSSSTDVSRDHEDDSVDIMNDYIHSPGPSSFPPPSTTPKNLEELKGFLEQQTDVIVASIQTLLNAMRQSGPYGEDFIHLVSDIRHSVDEVIQESSNATLEMQLKQKLGETLNDMTRVNTQIDTLSREMISSTPTKILKQKMASSTYEVARHVKDLLNLLE